MDVFLEVQQQNATIFLGTTEDTTVFELKKMIESITKVPPYLQELLIDDGQIMENSEDLGFYGLHRLSARAENPYPIFLTYIHNETMLSKTVGHHCHIYSDYQTPRESNPAKNNKENRDC